MVAMIMAGCGPSNEPHFTAERGFVNHIYRDDLGSESKFTVYVPASYDPQVACPAILFLHGAGQTGSDGKAQVQGGFADAIRSRETEFPFLAIFPQSHHGSWLADSTDGRRAIAMLEMVEQHYNVDRHRIYLTGYSMGGEGVWSIAAAHPDRFAAIVPICPSANLRVAPMLKDMPCWCFQGDADAANTLADTRKMLLAIKAAGGKPIYHEYPGIEHNCWDLTYRNEEVYDWLLNHRAAIGVATNACPVDSSAARVDAEQHD